MNNIDQERALFEAVVPDYVSEGHGFDLRKTNRGTYVNVEARMLWEGWKLRAQLPAAGVAVPDAWRNSLNELVEAMVRYEQDVDCEAPPAHRSMMRRARALLDAAPHPVSGEAVSDKAVEVDERAEYEKHRRLIDGIEDEALCRYETSGKYKYQEVQVAWEAWQARAALSPLAANVASAEPFGHWVSPKRGSMAGRKFTGCGPLPDTINTELYDTGLLYERPVAADAAQGFDVELGQKGSADRYFYEAGFHAGKCAGAGDVAVQAARAEAASEAVKVLKQHLLLIDQSPLTLELVAAVEKHTPAPAGQKVQPLATNVVRVPNVLPWRARIIANHPQSDPAFWPDYLISQHMQDEIWELRALLDTRQADGGEA